jgi:putative sigma-54 modulation protein
MQTSVTFKNLDPSEHLKSYVMEKLDRFDRLLDNPAEANVVLSVEKFRH